MLLLVLVWPLAHFHTERSALAAAFSALSKYATGVQADDFGLPDTQSVSAVSAAIADPQPFGSRAEIAAYQALADEAERLRGTLAALATEQQLRAETGMGDVAGLVRNALVAAGPLLDELAAALAAGRSPAAFEAERRALAGAVRELERTPSDTAPYVHDGRALVSQLRAAMRSATAAANGGLVIGDVPVIGEIAERPAGRKVMRLPKLLSQRKPVPQVGIGRIGRRPIRPDQHKQVGPEKELQPGRRHAPVKAVPARLVDSCAPSLCRMS